MTPPASEASARCGFPGCDAAKAWLGHRILAYDKNGDPVKIIWTDPETGVGLQHHPFVPSPSEAKA